MQWTCGQPPARKTGSPQPLAKLDFSSQSLEEEKRNAEQNNHSQLDSFLSTARSTQASPNKRSRLVFWIWTPQSGTTTSLQLQGNKKTTYQPQKTYQLRGNKRKRAHSKNRTHSKKEDPGHPGRSQKCPASAISRPIRRCRHSARSSGDGSVFWGVQRLPPPGAQSKPQKDMRQVKPFRLTSAFTLIFLADP